MENRWLITADRDLFEVVRGWAQGDLREFASPAGPHPAGSVLLIATPSPWRSIVAVAEQREEVLRPMLALKNAVALWSMAAPPADGPVSSEEWSDVRRRFLIHNPGLEGFLGLLDAPADS